MDAQHKRLLHLHDAVHDLGQKMIPKSGGGRDLEKIETLQDRWDALSLIMDMQAERVRIKLIFNLISQYYIVHPLFNAFL